MASLPFEITTKEHAQALIDDHKYFLFDCDGVIWLDEKLIPGVLETINYIKSKGKQFAFVTNNSAKSRKSYLEKFERLGFVGITKDHIFPTCYAAAKHLELQGIPKKSKVWVLGDIGIEQELEEMGYIPIGGCDKRLDDYFDPNHEMLVVDPQTKAVVVGSTKNFTYMRIASTLQYLLHDDKLIPFIGANIDRLYPGPNGLILPAGGSVVNYMQFTADRNFVNVGKPSTDFLDAIIATTGFKKLETLMIGDTLYTDIKFGNDGRLAGTLLVLSGGTKLPELHATVEKEDKSLIPNYYISSFGTIFELLK